MSKKLYRSNENKVFAGIFGGLGEYFDIDPVLFRIIWVFVTIFSGIVPGLVVYIIAIFVMPARRAPVARDAGWHEETAQKDTADKQ